MKIGYSLSGKINSQSSKRLVSSKKSSTSTSLELLSQNVDLLLTDNLIKIYNNVFFNNKNLKSNADRIQYNISNGKAVIDMYDKSNKIEILGNYGSN